MKYYQIVLNAGCVLEIELEDMNLTPEMVEEIINSHAPDCVGQEWDLFEKDNSGVWFTKFSSPDSPIG